MTTEGPRFIGGEMYAWSDRSRLPAPAGAALGSLLAPDVIRPGDRVLVAGPHDLGLLRRISDAGGRVTWLTRSLDDAKDAVDAIPGLNALAGSLAGDISAGGVYDVIVALDGLGRLCSAESAELTWDESLRTLLSVLTPDGTLLLAQHNPTGIHHLVQPEPWYTRRDDSAWILTGDSDPSRPDHLGDLIGQLAAAGFTTGDTYAAFPVPTRPAALISVALLGADQTETVRREVAGIVGDVCAHGFRDQPLFAEPELIASNAIRGGIGTGLAASWVVIAGRARAAVTSNRVIINDEDAAATWGVSYELTPLPGMGWARTAIGRAGVREHGDLRRDPALLDGIRPAGPPLERVLTAMCLRHDHVALRSLIRAYADWLDHLTATGDPGAAFAMPANVTYLDGTFAVIDPSWQSPVLPPLVLLAKALRAFAVELLVGGYNHPWPATMDADRLTVVLGAIAGRDLELATVDAAVTAEVAFRTTIAGTSEDGSREIAHRIAAAGSVSGPIEAHSFQQLRQAHARATEKIASLEDKLRWLDHLLASRERALRISHRRNDAFRRSISYRAGRAVLSPLLLVRAGYRRMIKRLRASG